MEKVPYSFNEIGTAVFKTTLAMIGALCVFIVPVAAMAQTATYNITGTFTAPATGSFSGSYVVDTGTNAMVSANIAVTAGKASDGVTNLPAEAYTWPGGEVAFAFGFASAVPATNQRGGFVVFAPTKAAPTSITNFTNSVCLNDFCSNADPSSDKSRSGAGTVAAAGAAAPVPTLSEWAMILFGTLLAGAGALYIQRRRISVSA